MKKRILIVLTNQNNYTPHNKGTGLWLGELTHFYKIAKKEGFELVLVSPKGGSVPIDPRSISPLFLDKQTKASYKDLSFMKLLNETLSPEKINADDYDAIYYTGGHGTMYDFPDNKALQEITSNIFEDGRIVSAVCHGVAGLLNIRLSNGQYLINGKNVTGYSWIEEKMVFVAKYVPFSLEKEIKSRGAIYKKAMIPFIPHVIKDRNLITGQNPQSTKAIARKVIETITSLHYRKNS